jgi:protoheme IX farnesyltransferase
MKPAVLLARDAVVLPVAAAEIPLPAESAHTLFSDLCELVKARLTTLVLTTTLAGFYLGWQGPMNYLALFNALFGTALVAGGAAALNELIERDADANMRRTRDRPLPAGRLQPDAALLIGFVLAAGGLLYLYFLVNALSSMLAGVTLASYLFAYTPLKRITTLNTLVGAIPGALPPVIGWAAARGSIDLQAWGLFAILFCWQMPHFLAIAWMYRDDYAGAGFVMLPNKDEDGASTGRQAVNYAGALLLVSLTPSLLGLASPLYFFGAFVLGSGMIYCAWQFQMLRTRPRARRLFFASIIYLPFLLALLALCKQPT